MKADTLTSGVYESREYQRTTVGHLQCETYRREKRRRESEKEMRSSESECKREVDIQT